MLMSTIQPKFTHYVVDFDPLVPVIWEEQTFRSFKFTEIVSMLLSPMWEQHLWHLIARMERFESQARYDELYLENFKNWELRREEFVALFVSSLPEVFDPIVDLQLHKWLTDKVAVFVPNTCYTTHLPMSFFS